ncbi:hypothetical protein [Pseudomonas aeruginosa]|uniref:hypothetical protein n=1 Tax=Pseudomonas aeruginosa TaxID=287 RepID=UPI001ADC5623|nr:hypothetical protein [Pseudomonas aeruginosa]HCF4080795.1 hypothetical protein [Pseudomonas aeruginosa]
MKRQQEAGQVAPFQSRVMDWLLECFGPAIAGDVTERNHRYLEEALELVQACGCTAAEAHNLVDYVFGRPVGETSQEVGGVMVTLAALCLAQGIDMSHAGEVELSRISQPEMVERIREKQKRKPAMSPLPGTYPDRVALIPSAAAEHHSAAIASELDTVKALLRGLLEGDAGASILSRLDSGQGTATEDGKLWVAARELLAKN